MVRRSVFTGSLLLVMAAGAWGAMFPVAQSALRALDPFAITWLRYGVAAPLFAAILIVVEGRRALRSEGRIWELAAFGTLGYAGFSLFVFSGLPSTTPEHASIIVTLMPLMTAIAVWVLRGQQPRTATFVAIAIALVGVALVVTKGDLAHLLGAGGSRGDAMVVAGAICWMLYTLGAGRFPGWSPLRYTTMTCLPGAVAITLLALVAGRAGYAQPWHVDTIVSVWPELLFLLVASSIFAVIGWNAGIKVLGPTNGVLFINLVPVTAFAVGVVQGHTFTWAELTGAGLTVIAVALNSLWNSARIPAAVHAGAQAPCPQRG